MTQPLPSPGLGTRLQAAFGAFLEPGRLTPAPARPANDNPPAAAPADLLGLSLLPFLPPEA